MKITQADNKEYHHNQQKLNPYACYPMTQRTCLSVYRCWRCCASVRLLSDRRILLLGYHELLCFLSIYWLMWIGLLLVIFLLSCNTLVAFIAAALRWVPCIFMNYAVVSVCWTVVDEFPAAEGSDVLSVAFSCCEHG